MTPGGSSGATGFGCVWLVNHDLRNVWRITQRVPSNATVRRDLRSVPGVQPGSPTRSCWSARSWHWRAASNRAVTLGSERVATRSAGLADLPAVAETISTRFERVSGEVEQAEVAALLHDVGMVALPWRLVANTGAVTLRRDGSWSSTRILGRDRAVV